MKETQPEELVINPMSDPLQEPIQERAYTQHNIRMKQTDMTGDIPEPRFSPPPINLDEPRINTTAPPKTPPPVNPEMKDMPKKEKAAAVKNIANTILKTYSWICDMVDKMLQFDEKTLNKYKINGEIDFSIEVPIDYKTGRTMAAGGLIKEFNEQSKGTITVTAEWVEEVRPVLERVLEKRGVGMTDEQLLGFLVVQDLIAKFLLAKACWDQKKQILDSLIQLTLEVRGQRADFRAAQNQAAPQGDQRTETARAADEIDEVYEPEEFEDRGTVSDRVDAQLQNTTVSEIRRGRGRPRKM